MLTFTLTKAKRVPIPGVKLPIIIAKKVCGISKNLADQCKASNNTIKKCNKIIIKKI